MKLSPARIALLLVFIYLVAVWTRLGDDRGDRYQYYNGDSGTNFRHAQVINQNGTLPEVLDREFWPDGYAPGPVQPNGIEFIAGWAYRAVTLISEQPERDFVRSFTLLFFSLSVFSMFLLVNRLWLCQAAGLFSALLVALYPPLVRATNGSEFLHGSFAFVFVSLHLGLVAALWRRQSTPITLVTAGVGFAMLGVWQGAGAYLGLVALGVVVARRLDTPSGKTLLVSHLAAMVLAGIAFPHLRATRFIADWPSILMLVATLQSVLGDRLPKRVPALAYLAGGFAILFAVYMPVRAGGIELLGGIDYWLDRLRFIGGKPDDPLALGEAARYLWTIDRTHPSPYSLFQFALPMMFLIPPAALALRFIRAKNGTPVWPVVAFATAGVVAYLFDRSAILFAVLGLFPFVSASLFGFSAHAKTRGLPIAIGVWLFASQLLFPAGAANVTYRVAPLVGLSAAKPDGFIFASIGNPDLDLVRHLVSRTSTREPFLTPIETSSLIATFAGRKTVLVPGIHTREVVERGFDLTGAFFKDENILYEACTQAGIQQVLYRIDYLLDQSVYSPSYFAGLPGIGAESAAYMMHFHPEALRHFTLEFENDTYRLFRVSEEMQPVFLTDHPPIYHIDVFRKSESVESFYANVLDVLITYYTGTEAQASGNDEDAIRRFRYCVERFPKFTRAWLGAGESLLRLNDVEAADAAYTKILEYAPDNTNALYHKALTLGRLGENERALGLLKVLRASTRDPTMLRLAQELEIIIQVGSGDTE